MGAPQEHRKSLKWRLQFLPDVGLESHTVPRLKVLTFSLTPVATYIRATQKVFPWEQDDNGGKLQTGGGGRNAVQLSVCILRGRTDGLIGAQHSTVFRVQYRTGAACPVTQPCGVGGSCHLFSEGVTRKCLSHGLEVQLNSVKGGDALQACVTGAVSSSAFLFDPARLGLRVYHRSGNADVEG